ncbi:MAG: hypothetical protein AAFZ15_01500 [Bacteroidota bacterium]
MPSQNTARCIGLKDLPEPRKQNISNVNYEGLPRTFSLLHFPYSAHFPYLPTLNQIY